MNSSAAERVHGPSPSFIRWRIQGRGPGALPPLFLDQTETRRAEKTFFGDRLPPLSKGLYDLPPPPPLSEGLDLALLFTTQTLKYVAYAVTLRSHGRAEAEEHKLEHILFLKVH